MGRAGSGTDDVVTATSGLIPAVAALYYTTMANLRFAWSGVE